MAILPPSSTTAHLLLRRAPNGEAATASGTSTPVAVAVALTTTAAVAIMLALVTWHLRFSRRARLARRDQANKDGRVHVQADSPTPLVSPSPTTPTPDGLLPLTPPRRLQERKLLPSPRATVQDRSWPDFPPESGRSSDATVTSARAESPHQGSFSPPPPPVSSSGPPPDPSQGLTRQCQRPLTGLTKCPGPPPSRALPPTPRDNTSQRTAGPTPPSPPRLAPAPRGATEGAICSPLLEEGELERLGGSYK
ncbi:hypothetical protein CP533_6611 [Ophiocordyceps camponoti-saundersi (nom. inval.)]|nr:hypothetical protein CP533_6611 [Ophiocordyceps camponoti-saundersi (nom. inval.)]